MMIRRHENPVAFKAGVLTLVVHAALIAAMLISFSWRNTQPISIAEVELWDALPAEEVVVNPLPKPVPDPVIKEEPKLEPKIELKPEIKEEPKADIQLEKKQKEDELRKKQAELDKLEKMKQQALLEDKLEKEKLVQEKQKQEAAIRKLAEEFLADDTKTAKSATADAKMTQASAGEVDKYKAMIQSKIQRHVNKPLCGDGKPELVFEITLMPTGEVQGNPKLIKSSSIGACDDAVERAILQSQPLPLPADVNLRAQFRNIRLIFHPNE